MALRFSDDDLAYERWIRGLLDYKLHGGQEKIEKAFHARKNQLFVGELSRQFGKTYWLVKKALETAYQKKRAKIKIGTAFQTDLLEFILPAFEAVMEDCPDELRPTWKSQQSKFIIPTTDSEIKLVGLDRKPNGLRGNVIDLIILDEAGFMSRLDYLYKSVIIPATTHRPDCPIIVLSTPPETPAHEFLDYVQKAEYEESYLKLTIYDNPLVDETTVSRLMREAGGPHSTTWRREYLCQHVTDANLQVVSNWKEEFVQEIERDEYYQFYHKYVNMDLGVHDQTAALWGYYDFRKAKYIIEDEFTINGPTMNTNILQAHLKLHELANWTDCKFRFQDEQMISDREIDEVNRLWEEKKPDVYLRVSDNNNPLLLQDLSHLHNIHFVATDKGRLSEMVNATKILVQDEAIIVHPRCKQAKGCLKYGVWDKFRREFAESKVYGHFDALAALIYGVRNLDRVTNPIPPTFKTDPDNQIIFVREQISESARTLKRMFAK
jgi:hypothetical protein